MATNLRLKPETETALREEADRTGRSQQDLIREALDQYLGLSELPPKARSSIQDLIDSGLVRPPTMPYRRATRLMKLPDGVTSLDLLDREDRF